MNVRQGSSGWTPEQALTVAEFLDRVLTELWDAHTDKLLDAIAQRDRLHGRHPRQMCLPFAGGLDDDDIPPSV